MICFRVGDGDAVSFTLCAPEAELLLLPEAFNIDVAAVVFGIAVEAALELAGEVNWLLVWSCGCDCDCDCE